MRKGNKKRKVIWTGVVMLYAAGLFAGCGETLPQKNTTDTTAQNAVEQTEKEAYRLTDLAQETGTLMCVTNDSIFVPASEDSCVYSNCIRQYDREGNERHSYSLGKGDVQGISGQFVCYTERSWDQKEILYIAPIDKEAKEETIVLKERKKIAELGASFDIYVWKSHVYYISEGDGIYHYNAESEQTKCLVKLDGEEDEGEFISRNEDTPYVDGDQRIYLAVNDDTCYRIEREKAKIERVPALDGKLSYESWDIFPIKDNLIFITNGKLGQSPDRYIWYDIGTKKERGSFQKKDLQKFLEQQGFEKKKLNSLDVSEVYSNGNRLYLFMNLLWEEKVTAETGPRKGKKVPVYKEREFLLSCPWENIQELRYEKEISEWIRDHQEYEQTYIDLSDECDERKYYTYMGRVQMWAFCGNELLISYQDKWEKEKRGVRRVEHCQLKGFDLATGQMRDISEKDTFYQLFNLSKKLDLDVI